MPENIPSSDALAKSSEYASFILSKNPCSDKPLIGAPLFKKRKRSKYILENLKALNKSSLNEKELKEIMKKWSQ